jgi:hypothetical protein
MLSIENVLASILKYFYIVQDDKIGRLMALTYNNLSNSWVLCILNFGDWVSEENLYEAEEKEISNILY